MSYDVTLRRLVPLERFDGVSYDTILLEEAAAEGGPWTPIDTIAVPVDANPAEPAPKDVTTRNATLAEGWYRVTWRDAFGGQTAPSEPFRRRLPNAVRPSIAEVAAVLRARTKIRGGGEAGTFTEATRPTGDQVGDLITEAEAEVLGKVAVPVVGADESGLYEQRVRGAIRLYTAVLIEMSYFPEQVASGKSPAAVYEKLYDSRIKALIAEGETGTPQGMGDTDSPADPAWIFPANRSLGVW